MKLGCFVYLVRTSQDDLKGLNQSLELLEKNVLSTCKTTPDIILFHEKSFSDLKQQVYCPKNTSIIFREVEFGEPNTKPEYFKTIPLFYPHPTHGPGGPYAHTLPEPHKGFTMGYRHMCDFFSGRMYEDSIFDNYEYYLRLDTDSFILSKVPYDLFEWMKSNEFDYGTIQQAIQIDNPKVVEGLWDFTQKWVSSEYPAMLDEVTKIPNGTMFYTNFELGKLSFFNKESSYKKYYEAIKNSGGIYFHRWGDAPIKYLGVKLFTNKIGYVSNFVYQHGAIYHT